MNESQAEFRKGSETETQDESRTAFEGGCHPRSLYGYISASVIDGQLPEDFSLPSLSSDDTQIAWMDGARDGVSIYHMGFTQISDEVRGLMESAVRAASEKDIAVADELFCRLGQSVRAIDAIDELQGYIMDHKEELSPGNIYGYGVHAILNSEDRECVKFGLSLLELFNTDGSEELKDVLRTLGMSDEFAIFVIFGMLDWEEGNDEIYRLARKLHGWGRIHAVERMEPETDEIRDWLLKEGVHNSIMWTYSALTCWQKSGAESILKNGPSQEEFAGIRDIIQGLLEEGPGPGISEIKDGEGMVAAFLKQARNMKLELADYEAIRSIRIHYQDGDSGNSRIVSLCEELLGSDDCRAAVKEAVKSGRALDLAQDLHVEYKDDVLCLLDAAFDENYYLCNLLMEDSNYRQKVMEIFRWRLPLAEIRTMPTESLGLGIKYKHEQQLESIVQELRKYPLEGIDLVETALQAAPIRTRNFGLAVLESWVCERDMPLKELMPEMYELLNRLKSVEVTDDVKKKMDELLEGRPLQ